jgi:hypothetical protein
MLCAEQTFSTFRVFASAMPAKKSEGFLAAAVVLRIGSHGLPVEVVFRDDELDDGRIWQEPGAAVRFGLEVGEAAARTLGALTVPLAASRGAAGLHCLPLSGTYETC